MMRSIAGKPGSGWFSGGLSSWVQVGLAVLVGCLFSGSGRTVRGADVLRWKFNPGETLRYTMVQETTQGMKAMGQEFKTNLSQTVDLHWSVKTVSPEGVADMSQTIDRVRMKVDGPGGGFEFDSQAGKAPEGPAANLLAPLLKTLVGAEFTLKMNARGELSDIKVPPTLVESLRKASPAASAGGMFSEDGLKNLIGQSSLALPEASLEKGKTWSNSSRLPVPMLGTMVMDKTYTYEGVDPKEASLVKIGLDTKVSLEPAADSNVAVKITSHDGKGEFAFDPQSGRMVTSRVNDKMQMSLSVMGQDLEQSSASITTMTLGKGGASK
jgi:Family of unknown function (DUF6263)